MIDTFVTDEYYNIDRYRAKPFDMYFGDASICVLDIETTGITAGTSHFVLGGLLTFEDGGRARLKQFFAESISEERELLTAYMAEASKCDVLLTYNGKSFDIPFLLSRAEKFGLGAFRMPYNLDLYLVLNRYSPLRKFLPNLKQKTVEDFMGLWEHRADRITGREFAMMYPDRVDLLLLHNQDDVLQLGRLLPVVAKADFHRAMHGLGFPVIAAGRTVHVVSVRAEGGGIVVRGIQVDRPVDYVSYGAEGLDWQVNFDGQSKAFAASFPALKAEHRELNRFIRSALIKILEEDLR